LRDGAFNCEFRSCPVHAPRRAKRRTAVWQ
jgi:hypothetical protein